MKILCPHCGVKGTADDSYCDRKVKCPKCQNIFVVQSEMAVELDVSPLIEESAPQSGAVQESEQQEDVLDDTSLEIEEDLRLEEPATEEPATEELVDDEQLIKDKVDEEEGFDWSEVAAEIDQQLQESDEKDADTEDSEEVLGLLDDLDEVDETHVTGPVASLTEEGEDATEDALLEESEDELEAVISDEEVDTIVAEEAEIQEEPYGLAKEQCWQCGKEDSVGEPFIAKDGRLYCTQCLPAESESVDELLKDSFDENVLSPDTGVELEAYSGFEQIRRTTPHYTFSIGEAIKEAWVRTKGAKGTIWAGSAVMYLVILILIAGSAMLLPAMKSGSPGLVTALASIIFNLAIDVISVLFMAGLLYMGVRKVVGDPISWKMVGKGFSCTGKIIVATILQSVLVTVGLLVLVLPGIYLMVGYAMTLPLIVDQGLSPWSAMEMSRKAVHKVWWKMFGLFFIMGIITTISLVPLGIGLIWTWPMAIVLAGVVYCYLFGGVQKVE